MVGRFTQLSSVYFLEHLLLFARTFALARLLGPEGFGVASSLLIVLQAFLVLTDLGIEKFILKSTDNEIMEAEPTLQSFQVIRGLVVAILIFFSSHFISEKLDNSDIQWMYALMAAVPLVEGFRHLDPIIHQKRLYFVPYARVHLSSLAIGVFVTIAIALLFDSPVAVALGALSTSCVSVILSHAFAVTPYRLKVRIDIISSVLDFGLPIFLSGTIVFVTSQSDRFIVPLFLGTSQLGLYLASGTIGGALAVLLGRVIGSLQLSLLSEARSDKGAFYKISRHWMGVITIIFGALFLPLAVFGDYVNTLLFGNGYQPPEGIVTYLVLGSGCLLVRTWFITSLMSIGKTGALVAISLVRGLGMVGAVAGLRQGHDITFVAACFMFGECLATLAACICVDRAVPFVRRIGWLGCVISIFSATVIITGLWTIDYADSPSYKVPLTGLACAFSVFAGVLLLRIKNQGLREVWLVLCSPCKRFFGR